MLSIKIPLELFASGLAKLESDKPFSRPARAKMRRRLHLTVLLSAQIRGPTMPQKRL